MAGIFENDKGILEANMAENKLKVAMVCEFSDSKVREKLNFKIGLIEYIARKIFKKSTDPKKIIGDYCVWITNAIREFETMTEQIELHVISHQQYIKPNLQDFQKNGIFYHFYRGVHYKSVSSMMKNFFMPKKKFSDMKKTRKIISTIIKTLSPNIVYLIGAENPHYSLSALEVPSSLPLLVQLQTLMSDPDFEKNYPISHDVYNWRASNELKVLKRADYIGCNVRKYTDIIKKTLVPSSVILKSNLAVGETVDIDTSIKKDFDFVYFAANIHKAFDLALEGFILAHKTNPNIKLLVIGAYHIDYKQKMDERIKNEGLTDCITFTGRLPTHEDVLHEIQKARFALLPLKIDITSGTIREAMSRGLPVITTITAGGTTRLNEKKETVLLSGIGDHQTLADNMLRLVGDEQLANTLRENGLQLLQERYNNHNNVLQQVAILRAAVANFRDGIPIPEDLLS